MECECRPGHLAAAKAVDLRAAGLHGDFQIAFGTASQFLERQAGVSLLRRYLADRNTAESHTQNEAMRRSGTVMGEVFADEIPVADSPIQFG